MHSHDAPINSCDQKLAAKWFGYQPSQARTFAMGQLSEI